jgi:hypothetical protein
MFISWYWGLTQNNNTRLLDALWTNHSPIATSTSGGVKQPICHLLKQWSQINMVITPCDSPHNMHYKFAKIMINDGSTWPFTCGRWHGAQFHTWSFHIKPSKPFNKKILKDKTLFTYLMTRLIITSNLLGVVYDK